MVLLLSHFVVFFYILSDAWVLKILTNVRVVLLSAQIGMRFLENPFS